MLNLIAAAIEIDYLLLTALAETPAEVTEEKLVTIGQHMDATCDMLLTTVTVLKAMFEGTPEQVADLERVRVLAARQREAAALLRSFSQSVPATATVH